MIQNETGLHTLDYRIDPAALGSLVLYPMPPAFRSAWEQFEKSVRQRAGRDSLSPRYSNLATALTAVTGQPIGLFPRGDLSRRQQAEGIDSLLITTAPIDPWLLSTAARAFERLCLQHEQADTLAAHLNDPRPQIMEVTEFIEVHQDQITAPGWVYRMAEWNLAAAIAAKPLVIDDQLPISLRLDTTGNLVAWDNPVTRTWSNGQHHATVHVSTSIVTLPGAGHLYLRIDGHVARMPNTWWDIKNAWIAPTDCAQPLLRLPVCGPWPAKGRHHPQYRDFVTEIVNRCQLSPLPELPETFGHGPGAVRLIGKPSKHPVGKGPGARFLFQLQQQVRDRLELPDLTYKKTKISVSAPIGGAIPADKIDVAIVESGVQRLRMLCLYGDRHSRRRMVDALTDYSSKDADELIGADDDRPVQLTGRLSVVFHRNEALLAHGDHRRDIGEIPYLAGDNDTAVVAWV
ncbi:pPIWI_RE module domain-containing protein, partial [Nocardia sp. XZ_19_369]|uniref:pPIWI_RE module domain-containing protein n=1 Tax=Nocardia sp. XZ_19_369 TaxID=2769487 RepID=UPI00188E88B7